MAHRSRLTALQSVDLDTDTGIGAHLEEDYFGGWAPEQWSAKGPAVYAPRMSVLRSAQTHLRWAIGGWKDANNWGRATALIGSSRGLQIVLAKGLFLSAVLCACVYIFSLELVPDEVFSSSDSERSTWIASVSNVFWLYPLIAGIYFFASHFTVGIAEEAMRARNMSSHPVAQTWIDYLCRAALIINYTILCYALSCLPWFGSIPTFFTMCMVDGYFCFELVWSARGWSFEKVGSWLT